MDEEWLRDGLLDYLVDSVQLLAWLLLALAAAGVWAGYGAASRDRCPGLPRPGSRG
jgi:hypothetical protein